MMKKLKAIKFDKTRLQKRPGTVKGLPTFSPSMENPFYKGGKNAYIWPGFLGSDFFDFSPTDAANQHRTARPRTGGPVPLTKPVFLPGGY